MTLIKDEHVNEIEHTLRGLSTLAVSIAREPYAAHVSATKTELLSLGLRAAELVELIGQARRGYVTSVSVTGANPSGGL